MAKEHTLRTPLKAVDIGGLNLGDLVYIDGEIVITAGLPTHKRIMQYIENGQSLPIDLKNAVFLHIGSYSREHNGKFEVVYVNPTTSTRFNPYMPKIISTFQLRAVGGKGGLDKDCVESMKEAGGVYLSVLGAGCSLFTDAIKGVETVAWEDFVSHYRLVNLKVEKFGPLIVAIDAHGNSIYENIRSGISDKRPEILRELTKADE